MKDYLIYPEGYTEAKANKVSNGCGTAGWKGAIVPDTIYTIRITDACNIHDFEYHYGMTMHSKDVADNRFLLNMHRIINKKSKWSKFLNPLRKVRAQEYYLAVAHLGEKAFLANKEGIIR